MRILILANRDRGLYKFRRELLEELVKSHEVFFALPAGEFVQALQALGCQYIPFEFKRRDMNPMAALWQIHRYRKLLRQIQPDIVLTYTIKPNIYGGIACQREHIPYISNVTGLGTSIEDGGVLGRISLALYRYGLRAAQCVFFQNSANRQFFLDRQIVREESSQVIPGSGVNLEMHKLLPYPSEDKSIQFLFVGRIMRDKGIGELLLAFDEIHKNHPETRLDIVGDYDEPEWAEKIQAAVASSGGVHYHGRQMDVRPFYRECHCVVLPSYHEGCSNVLLEASANGRPVISTRVPGCQIAYEDGTTGLGCEAHDSASLVSAMEKFLRLSHEEKERMGKAARQKMTDEFDRNIVVGRYLTGILQTADSGINFS